MKEKIDKFLQKLAGIYFLIPIVFLLYLGSHLVNSHWGLFHFKQWLIYLLAILIPLAFIYSAIFYKKSWKNRVLETIIPVTIGSLLFWYAFSLEYVPFKDLRKDRRQYENHQMLKPRRY